MNLSTRLELDGQTALVTGASGGLGRHFASVLAAAGATVVLCARRTDLLEHAAAEINDRGGKAVAVAMDVSDPVAVTQAFDAAEAAAGPVSILIANSGVADQRWFTQTDEVAWRKVLDVNLDGVYRVGREAASRMRKHGNGGSIVNIASVLGLAVARTLSAYAVSKAAVVQLTKAMAVELASDNIRVNAIAPGYFVTDMNRDFLLSPAGEEMLRRFPMARAGKMEELDLPLLLLASPAGSYMTGTVIPVDGGTLLSGL